MYQTQVITETPETLKVQFAKPHLLFELRKDGQPYYFRHMDGKSTVININLPESGVYTSEQPFNIIRRGEIEKYNTSKIVLPKPDRNYPVEGIKVEKNQRGDMGTTPARIFPQLGIIETAPVFDTYPKPIKLFILLHELGHTQYSREIDADLFALKQYLDLGYNGSMAFYALSHILKVSPANIIRLKKVFAHLMNYKG